MEQFKRKKILLITDSILLPSGVGTIGKEIVLNSSHHYNWVNLGCAPNNPKIGKILDLSKDFNKQMGLTDSYVRVYPYQTYGDMNILRQIMEIEKPDAILLITDPRSFTYIWENEHEIRSKIPICYLNIWDQEELPPYYNLPYYESCDLLMAISKATQIVNEKVIEKSILKQKPLITYNPHGKNPDIFKPIDKDDPKLIEFKKKFIANPTDDDFVLLFNSRNIQRKNVPNTLLAWKEFIKITPHPETCYFILHTNPKDPKGPDLEAIKRDIIGENYNIIFDTKIRSEEEMNLLYNIADATILASYNEGWGLALTESMLAGTSIIATHTGGMKDQLLKNEIDDGSWAHSIYSDVKEVIGSQNTPYIYKDIANVCSIAFRIHDMYKEKKINKRDFGSEGREHCLKNKFTSKGMAERTIEAIDKTLENFKSREKYQIIKL